LTRISSLTIRRKKLSEHLTKFMETELRAWLELACGTTGKDMTLLVSE
jgi:hypothetical protein